MIFYNTSGAFGITTLQFGSVGDPSQLGYVGMQAFNMLSRCRISNVVAYVTSGADTSIFEITLPDTSNLAGDSSVGVEISTPIA